MRQATRVPVARTSDGVDIAWYDLGPAGATGSAGSGGSAAGGGRPLLLAHATGFHGRVWLPVAERLAEAGFHCFTFDERGHGDSGRPADGSFDWDGFGTDVLAVVAALAEAGLSDQGLLAAGHSCGSVAVLRAEARHPGTFRSMYLWEPVIPPVDP